MPNDRAVKLMTAFYLDRESRLRFHCLDSYKAFQLTNRIRIINILPSTALFGSTLGWNWENSRFERIFTCLLFLLRSLRLFSQFNDLSDNHV